jgi:hypothetical protein
VQTTNVSPQAFLLNGKTRIISATATSTT